MARSDPDHNESQAYCAQNSNPERAILRAQAITAHGQDIYPARGMISSLPRCRRKRGQTRLRSRLLRCSERKRWRENQTRRDQPVFSITLQVFQLIDAQPSGKPKPTSTGLQQAGPVLTPILADNLTRLWNNHCKITAAHSSTRLNQCPRPDGAAIAHVGVHIFQHPSDAYTFDGAAAETPVPL